MNARLQRRFRDAQARGDLAVRGSLEADHLEDLAAVRGKGCERLEVPAMLLGREERRLRSRPESSRSVRLGIEGDLVTAAANVLEAGVAGDVPRVGPKGRVTMKPVIGEAGQRPAQRLLDQIALEVPVAEAK